MALGNSKALNALFNGVDKNIFRLINTCTVAKDAWEILKTTHEGTSKVKMSRLQLLATKFENLKMEEWECIHDFHMNILEIANACTTLGERMTDEKLVRKILRSLPKRFDMKVTAIEEAQDICSMRVDELIGSLQTFELGLSKRTEKKTKNLALMSNDEGEEDQLDLDTDEGLINTMMLLGKQFNKLMKKMEGRSKQHVQNISSDIRKNSEHQRKQDDKSEQNRGIQCHGCDGYGHIKSECPTFLKRQRKVLNVCWSDESESDYESESSKNEHAFIGKYASDSDSSDDELTFDELAKSYKELCFRSLEEITLLQAEKKQQLVEIDKLKEEVALLNSKLEGMTKSVRMMNSSSKVLDELLEIGKPAGDQTGLGFNHQSIRKDSKIKFVPAALNSEPKMSRHPSRHHGKQQKKAQRQHWKCHYCGKQGHIKPFCYELLGCSNHGPR